jgi:NAD(P)-dependent dehydrogenase (short-subunit alcohol dehydrogenase family)
VRQAGHSFAGKVAIVTGGASGIGYELGAELFRQGSHVVLADIDGTVLDAAATLTAALGQSSSGSIEGHAVDVTDADAVLELVQTVATERGQLDLMFNNAGISIGGPTHEMEPIHWDRIVDVNLRGVINGVQAAYPLMVGQGHGHIVNTASGAGLVPVVLTVGYSATKFAVVGLSTSLRPEAATHGVRVSVLCPGAVDTPILDRAAPADLPSMSAAALTGRQFMQRLRVHPIPASRFAPPALRGVARNQAIIVVPRASKSMWYLNRISPAAIERVGAVMIRRMR